MTLATEADDQITFFGHVRQRLPKYEFKNIFDVGANIGQSSILFAELAPNAQIYAFEPVELTYSALVEKTGHIINIKTINIALGDTIGQVSMQAKGTSTSNRILEGTPLAHRGRLVSISRGENFMVENCIESISYLKIDAEGHDMAVLNGFKKVLNKIDFVQVECSMNPTNDRHVPFIDFMKFFSENGFYLFYIYEQNFEFHDGGRPWLRRSNPAFIRAAIF